MQASCYSCEVGIGVVFDETLGGVASPIGVCASCHAFACGRHGIRDAVVPEFVCVQCDPLRLAASAAAAAVEGAGASRRVDRLVSIAGPWTDLAMQATWRFRSLDELRRRRHHYLDLIEFEPIVHPDLPEFSAQLVTTAARLTKRLVKREHWRGAAPGFDPFEILDAARSLELPV